MERVCEGSSQRTSRGGGCKGGCVLPAAGTIVSGYEVPTTTEELWATELWIGS